MTAWDAWHAERLSIQHRYVTSALDDAANKAGEAVAALAERLAALPARTAEGFRVKLRALSQYSRGILLSELPDLPDPDHILSHSLWRDVQGDLPTPEEAPLPTAAAAIDFGLDAPIAELAAEFCQTYARHTVADRAMMAGTMTEEEWEPHYRATVALMERLEETEPKTLLGMALKCLPVIAAAWEVTTDADLTSSDVSRSERLGAQFQAELMAGKLAPFTATGPDLVGMLNLPAVSMKDLRSLHDIADEVSSVTYAMAWSGRCHAREWSSRNAPGEGFNAAGVLMSWLGEALTGVQSAALKEARSRTPATDDDREARLSMLAVSTIDNGDPEETAAFARELLASVEK